MLCKVDKVPKQSVELCGDSCMLCVICGMQKTKGGGQDISPDTSSGRQLFYKGNYVKANTRLPFSPCQLNI